LRVQVYWPGIVIGLLVGAYWARVLKLVFKARRETGRSANFLPPEPVGRAIRIVWYPLTLLWILVPLLVGFGAAGRLPGLQFLYHNTPLSWLAVLVAVAAFLATLVCWKRMGKSWRMGIDPAEKTRLIVTGPYAYVRHPIYAFQCVLVVASFIAVPTWLMLAVAVLVVAFLQWEARREERYLTSVHGDDYATYLSRVGRFVPRSLGGYQPPLTPVHGD
jgi:protein-S-isoprenylcysteine O-methyltransferase Ste14